MLKQQIVVTLPEVLTIQGLRIALKALPIIARNDTDNLEVSEFSFAPPTGVVNVHFDSSNVQVVLAEAAVAYAAISDWIKASTPPGVSATFSHPLAHASANFNRGRFASQWRSLIPAQRILLPNLWLANTLSDEHQVIVERLARKATGSAIKRLSETGAITAWEVEEWLFETIYEALLNVAQHAGVASLVGKLPAYLAVSLVEPKLFLDATCGVYQHRDDTVGDQERHWITEMAKQRSWLLEVAVADNGKGFRSGLREKIDVEVPEYQNVTAGLSGNARFRALQDAAITFALTPYGSRKPTRFFASKSLADSWRGLFRILYHTTNVGGAVSIASGHGSYGGVATRGITTFGPLSRPANARGFPWTSFRASVSLGALKQRRIAAEAPESAATTLPISDVISVNLSLALTSITDDTFEEYAISVERQIRSCWKSWQGTFPSDGATGQTVLMIVHPSLPITSRFEPVSARPGATSLDGRARLIAQLLLRWMTPGPVLVHCFLLEGSDRGKSFEDLVERVQDYVAAILLRDIEKNPTPDVGIQGLCSPGRPRIRFVFSHPRQSNIEISSTPQISKKMNHAWRRLQAYFPDCDRLAAGHSSLGLDQIEEANSRFLQLLVDRCSAHADGSRRGKWYWRSTQSGRGAKSDVVLTPSGAIASEYLSVWGLSKANDTFLLALSVSLAVFLQKTLRERGHSSRCLLVPDSTYSSYLLLRRLEPSVRAQLDKQSSELLLIARPEAFASTFRVGDVIVVFGDFRARGTTIRNRIDAIRNTLSYATTMASLDVGMLSADDQALARNNLAIYIAVDGAKDTPLLFPDVPQSRCAHYDINGSYHENPGDWAQLTSTALDHSHETHVYAVNPVTAELLPWDRSAQLRSYLHLAWSKQRPSTTRAFDISREPHENSNAGIDGLMYGLQYFGGRFFSCRWPVARNLQLEPIEQALVKAISQEIEHFSLDTLGDIILCCRTSSDLPKAINSIGTRLAKALAHRHWSGSVRLAEMETVVVRDRQVFVSSVEEAVDRARHVGARLEPRQRGLDLVIEKVQPQVPYALVFLDNSSVTGRTLHEFLSLTSQMQPSLFSLLRGIVLFPIVTRLPITEEFVLQHVALRPYANSESTKSDSHVPVSLAALVQLRAPSYEHLEQLPLFQRLRELLARAEGDIDPPLDEVERNIEQVIDALMRARSAENHQERQCVTCALLPPSQGSGARKVSAKAANLRQLIALHVIGLPCWKELMDAFHEVARANPSELTLILALEPDLLEADEFVSALRSDVSEICREVIETALGAEDVLNALWVGILVRAPAQTLVSAIRANAKHQRTLLLNLAFLIRFSGTNANATEWAQIVLASIQNTPHEPGSVLTKIFGSLAIPETDVGGKEIKTIPEAQAAIVEYLINNRYKHGVGIAADWQRAREDLVAYIKKQRPTLNYRDGAVRGWLFNVLIPTYEAFYLLMGNFGRAKAGIPSPKTVRTSLLTALESLKIASAMNGSRELSFDNHYVATVNALLRYSSMLYTDQLFATTSRVNLRPRSSQAWPSNESLVDWAVPTIVSEPISVIFAHMKVLAKHAIYDFEVQHSDWCWPRRGVAGDVSSVNFLRDIWLSSEKESIPPPGVFLLWGDHASAFSEATRLWLDEASRHGHLEGQFGLQIRMTTATRDGRKRLNIVIRNEVKQVRIPGRHQGFSELNKALSRCGGSATRAESAGEYVLTIDMEIDYHAFPESKDHK